MSGASRDLLQGLFDALLKELHRRLKGDPSTDELSIARQFLRDQSIPLAPTSEAERRRAQALRKLYIQRLHEGLGAERPTAALLREVNAFLSSAGMVDGIGNHIEARKALAQLTAADLPFQ